MVQSEWKIRKANKMNVVLGLATRELKMQNQRQDKKN